MTRLSATRWLVAGLLAIAAPVALAQAAPAAGPATPAAADAKSGPDARDDDRIDRNCLRHTGSRIVAREAVRERGRADRRCVAAAGRVYSRDDLRRTGHVDIADALRTLDPSIH